MVRDTAPLAPREDGYRLCHRAQGTKGEHAYGAYVLAFPAQRNDPATLLTRYRSGMSLRPLLFSLDPEGDPAALGELAEHCGLRKGEVIVDGAEIVSVEPIDLSTYEGAPGPSAFRVRYRHRRGDVRTAMVELLPGGGIRTNAFKD